MTNEELLNPIAEMFADQAKIIDEQSKSTGEKLQSMESEMKSIGSEIKSIRIDMENDITKRIDALFDGYKLTHEKQWELERRMEALERRVDRIEIAG